MNCSQCGKELQEGSAFCGGCGAPVQGPDQPLAAQQTPASLPSVPAGQPAPTMPAPAFPPAQPRKLKKPLLIGIIALAVIAVAVVITLGFVGPKWFLGGKTAMNPDVFCQARETISPFSARCPEIVEKAVDKFLKSMENKDAKALLSLMDPDSKKLIEGIMKMMGLGSLEDVINEVLFEYKSIRFSGVKYQTEIKGDRATVNIVAGTVTGTDEDGTTFTEDIAESEYSQIHLVKKNGNWYIKMEHF